MKYCHTLVKYKQLFKGEPSFQIVSSLKFNQIGKKTMKFCAISYSTSFQGASKGGLHMECKTCLCLVVLLNAKHSLGSHAKGDQQASSSQRDVELKANFTMAWLKRSVFIPTHLSPLESLFTHTKENKIPKI